MYNVTNIPNGNANGNERDNEMSKSQNFNKLKINNSGKYNSAKKENTTGHNWWANKHDEFSQGEKNDIQQKKMEIKNRNFDNVFHGKKKINYEENVSNSRSYLEEFNVIGLIINA